MAVAPDGGMNWYIVRSDGDWNVGWFGGVIRFAWSMDCRLWVARVRWGSVSTPGVLSSCHLIFLVSSFLSLAGTGAGCLVLAALLVDIELGVFE